MSQTFIVERQIQYQTQPIKPFDRILDIIIVMKGCVMDSTLRILIDNKFKVCKKHIQIEWI